MQVFALVVFVKFAATSKNTNSNNSLAIDYPKCKYGQNPLRWT